jgi:hypothetical protein
MPKIVYATKDEIPENVREKAVQEGEVWVVDAAPLLQKHQELLTNNSKYKTVYDKFVGLGDKVDAATIQKALKEMEEGDQREQQVLQRIAQAVQENNKTRDREVSTARDAEGRMKGRLEKELIDNVLIKEIVAQEGDEFLVTPHLRSNLKIVEKDGDFVVQVVGKDGKARVSAKTGEAMTITELVGEAKADKKYAPAFKAPAASGGGSSSDRGQGGNGNGGGGQVATVKLTRQEAVQPALYRAALEKAGNDATKIQVVD